MDGIHEGALSPCRRTTQAHARTRHASCVMRAQQRNTSVPSSSLLTTIKASSLQQLYNDDYDDIVLLVCVNITQSAKVCTPSALPSSDVLISLVSLRLIAHCSHFHALHSIFCSVVKLILVFSMFSMILLSLSHCSPLFA